MQSLNVLSSVVMNVVSETFRAYAGKVTLVFTVSDGFCGCVKGKQKAQQDLLSPPQTQSTSAPMMVRKAT